MGNTSSCGFPDPTGDVYGKAYNTSTDTFLARTFTKENKKCIQLCGKGEVIPNVNTSTACQKAFKANLNEIVIGIKVPKYVAAQWTNKTCYAYREHKKVC